MTEHLCTPEGYRKKLKEIEFSTDPIYHLCKFYSEKPDMSYGGKIFEERFLPYIAAYAQKKDVCLDIGYGPGAMIKAASRYFKMSCGIDVHDATRLIGRFLIQNNCKNWILFQSNDGKNLPLNYYFNFIYSWTVFMHLGSIKVAKTLLQQTYDHLVDHGIAVIYFSRVTRKPEGETYIEFLKSLKKEENEFPPYIEYPNKPLNQINLRIGLKYMRKICEKIGFRILETTASSKVINGETIYLGQHGIILQKP